MTPAHEVPPVCRCGWHDTLEEPAEAPWSDAACEPDYCPARPGATRPAPNRREERFGSFGNKCALRDRWPGHHIRGDSHRNSEQMSVDQSNYLRKNQQVVGRTGRIKPDGTPRPLPGPDVPGWVL